MQFDQDHTNDTTAPLLPTKANMMMSITPPTNRTTNKSNNRNHQASSSHSIPIVQCEEMLREDIELHQQTVQADHVDLAFCTRLVDGMRKQQLHQRNPSTIFENQILIDHIIDTRRGVDVVVVNNNNNNINFCYRHQQDSSLSPTWFNASYRSDDGSRMSQAEEDMIFDMDL